MFTHPVHMSVAGSCVSLRILADSAGRTGLSRIHAHWWQLHQWLMQHGVDVTADAIDLALGEGVHLSGIDLSTLLIRSDKDLDDQTDDAYMQMRIARKLGLDRVTLFGGSRDTKAYDYLVAALLRLTTLADRLGLDMLLGNRSGTCLEQIDDVSRAISDVGAHNLHVDLDVAEFHIACVNPCDAFLAFGSRTACVRLSNVHAGLPAALGDGELHVPAILRALQETESRCPFVLKLGDDDDAQPRLSADVLYLDSAGYKTG